jgi:membrane associated rhomboid family serine protease
MATCYRHPDRETAVSCSNCGRPICPDCMTPTSVGMRCPECSREKTRVVRRGYGGAEPIATYALIGICVAAFIAELATGGTLGEARLSDAAREGAVSKAGVASGDIYRLLTAGFLHADITHLLFNMVSLWILGQLLEPQFGHVRFLLIFLVSVLAGSLAIIITDSAGLGASAGVFGLLGAGLVSQWMGGYSINPTQNGLALWLGINLVLSFRPGISLAGHIGGLIGGAVAAAVLHLVTSEARLREPLPSVILAGVAGLTLLLGIVAAG